MSIALEIQRITNARNKIRAKMVEFGLGISTADIDDCATAIDGIAYIGNVSATVKEGDTYKIAKGYHNGSGTVSAIAGGGNYKLESKTVTPSKSQQAVTPSDGFYGLSDVTVNAIPSIYQDVSAVTAGAADVLANKVIVDKTGKAIPGTMPNNGAVSKTLTAEDTSYSVPKGYHSGLGTVKIVPETKEVTPTKKPQTVVPTVGQVLSKVTVGAIPANYIDTSAGDAVAADILAGKKAYADGSLVTGTMPNNGSASKTIDAMNASSVSIPAGYTSGGTVSITDSVETALAAI